MADQDSTINFEERMGRLKEQYERIGHVDSAESMKLKYPELSLSIAYVTKARETDGLVKELFELLDFAIKEKDKWVVFAQAQAARTLPCNVALLSAKAALFSEYK